MGVVAIAAAVAGLSGPAIAAAANAASTEEDADYVEFDLDGNATEDTGYVEFGSGGKTVKGWVTPSKKSVNYPRSEFANDEKEKRRRFFLRNR